jgi:hypothetical protein
MFLHVLVVACFDTQVENGLEDALDGSPRIMVPQTFDEKAVPFQSKGFLGVIDGDTLHSSAPLDEVSQRDHATPLHEQVLTASV